MIVVYLVTVAGVSTINGSLVAVSNDLSIQTLQMNCFTFIVQPNQVTWLIDTVPITPDSDYQSVNESVLLDSADQVYRHSINVTGSFSKGTTIRCQTIVNFLAHGMNYELQCTY